MKYQRADIVLTILIILFMVITFSCSILNQILYANDETYEADLASEVAYRTAAWGFYPLYIISCIYVHVYSGNEMINLSIVWEKIVRICVPRYRSRNVIFFLLISTIILDTVLMITCNMMSKTCNEWSLPSLFILFHFLGMMALPMWNDNMKNKTSPVADSLS